MPKHKSALKRLRQDTARRARNRSQKSRMNLSIKKVIAATAGEGSDVEEVKGLYTAAVSTIDKTAAKGAIHVNKAARKIGRLTKAVNKAIGTDWLGGPKTPPMTKPARESVVEPEVVEPAIAAEPPSESPAEAPVSEPISATEAEEVEERAAEDESEEPEAEETPEEEPSDEADETDDSFEEEKTE